MISGVINTVENKYSPVTAYTNTKIIDHDEDTGMDDFVSTTITFSYPIVSDMVFVVTNTVINPSVLKCEYTDLRGNVYMMSQNSYENIGEKRYFVFGPPSGPSMIMQDITVYVDFAPIGGKLYEVDIAPYNKNEISLSLQHTSLDLYKGVDTEITLTVTANSYVHDIRIYYVNNGNFDNKIQFSLDREEWTTNYIDIDEIHNGQSKTIYVKITPPVTLDNLWTEDITFRAAYRYTTS